jgi:Mn-dependent DtxR family transcriptional regulator
MSPVSLADLRRGKIRPAPRRESHPGRVLALLRKHANQAWRAQEIADRLDVDAHTIGAALRRLHSRGLVDKQGPFWFALSDEESAHLRAFLLTTQELNRELGTENPQDWAHLPHD